MYVNSKYSPSKCASASWTRSQILSHICYNGMDGFSHAPPGHRGCANAAADWTAG